MLNKIKEKFIKDIRQAKDLKELEEICRCCLGRKGELTKILRSLKDLSGEERKEKGQIANQIKKELENLFQEKKLRFTNDLPHRQTNWIDVTAPGILPDQGHLHPLTLVQKEIEEIFQSMGFSVVDGPEVETEQYNFNALNVPKDHPARDLWDTFWLKDLDLLLRTHTSPVQARYMEKNNPPLRIIVPGRCFRHEATDATHDVQFYQFEGLMVGKKVSAVNFKGIIEEFFKQFFKSDVKVRLRPSYFPFVEPGFEVDVKRNGDWLEIMGAGMVHPNVFKEVGYNPNNWQGFAFGAGLERLAMIKYQIDDIRLFYSSDLRFLNQF
ncbi:phenylalanine--tRNA ligase subunit alpha [Patescibacteria group bacterium]|nr:phenylalanine--tRNA ligase subunit alpha [Patescibacteria group bacterium]